VLAVYAALLAAGVLAWVRMPQELFPDLRFPRLTVVTFLPNASPDEVENLVTKPIEQILGTVKNVRRLDSTSKEQVSLVNAEFRWETDMDAAMLWVQEKLGLVQDQLPLESRKPIVLRYNPFDRPVVLMTVTGDVPAADLQHLVETRVKPRLEKVPGVSAVEVGGALQREIQIDLDAQKLNANRLSVLDVSEALSRRNVTRSAGSATEGLFEYPVTISGAFTDLDGVRQAVVRLGGPEDERRGEMGALLRLENLGQVKDGVRERTSFARFDGKDTISVGIYKRSEAFPVDVSREARAALDELRRQLPSRVRLEIIYDQSIYIKEGIGDVILNVFLGGLLAYVVLWGFLRSHKRAGIVGVTIPVALLMTIAVLFRMGFTINLLTLGGLALGVGMLVDAAVVIMENISRHVELGKPVQQAVVDGGEEVGKAVFFCVMTHLAAFGPIPFAGVGVAQRVFAPICASIVISQIMSLIAGFTLLPALISIFIKDEPRRAGAKSGKTSDAVRRSAIPLFRHFQPILAFVGQRASRLIAMIQQEYETVLTWSVGHRRRLLWIVLGTTGASLLLLAFGVPHESMPDVDQDQFIVKLTMPTGTRLEVTDRVARRLDDILAAMPEIAHRDVLVGSPAVDLPTAQGPHQAQIVVDLAEKVRTPKGRTRSRRRCREIIRDAAKSFRSVDLEGGRTELSAQGSDVFSQVFSKGGSDLLIEVKGQDMEKLKEAAANLEEKLRSLKGVSKVTDSLAVPSPQISYKLDDLKLSRDGLSAADAADLVLAAVHGQVPTKFREKGREIDVRVRLREEDRKDVTALSGLVVPNPLDKSGHPLSEYGTVEMAPGSSEIRRRDQARAILIELSLSGRSLSDVLPEIRQLLTSIGGKGGTTASLGGEVEESRASFQSLIYGFAASIALVYIVLVAQFNALWIPLVAMTAVPLSLNGVAPALILSGHTLNLMSGQGLVMLAGIVVNNSLMLLEFIQQRRAEGEPPERAAVEASRARLRPILMTVIGTVAGLLPLALGIGKGAEMQAPMAVTVIFGLVVSTVLTLIVMPAIYLEARAWVEKT
jgi:HAE1 family hydrophobic/amphiphilic exporter-1